MKIAGAITGAIFAISLQGCACAARMKPLDTVGSVDLKRYVGQWYEIARMPFWAEKDCAGVTATYAVKANGDIEVLNRCRDTRKEGKTSEARGTAKVVDASTNARLKVTFFWPFYGAYWVIQLDPAYQWAVVGEPGRKYLWILCRTPKMEPQLYKEIVEKAAAQGYDTSRLIITEQP